MAVSPKKEAALKDYVTLQAIKDEVSKRTNGSKALLEQMVAETEKNLKKVMFGPAKKPYADSDDIVHATIKHSREWFDIIPFLPRILAYSVAGALVLSVMCHKCTSHENVQAQTSSQHIERDSRQYFNPSLLGKDAFTASSFPNHIRNPESNLEKILGGFYSDPSLMRAILEHESVDWDPNAIAPVRTVDVIENGVKVEKKVRAAGLGQFIVSTANIYGKELHFDEIKYPIIVDGIRYTETDPCTDPEFDWRFDPEKVAQATVLHMRDLKRNYSDIGFAIAAYNCGDNNVLKAMEKARSTDFDKANDYLPLETQKFVFKVLEKKSLYDMCLPFSGGSKFYVTSDFGSRNNPFGSGTEFHEGIDFGAPIGTNVVSTTDGTVVMAGNTGNGYGNQVWIKDNFGNLHLFGHLNSVRVNQGMNVRRGSYIGDVGNTGLSEGPHLHYGFFDLPENFNGMNVRSINDISGFAKDPMRYLNKKIILKQDVVVAGK